MREGNKNRLGKEKEGKEAKDGKEGGPKLRGESGAVGLGEGERFVGCESREGEDKGDNVGDLGGESHRISTGESGGDESSIDIGDGGEKEKKSFEESIGEELKSGRDAERVEDLV